VVPLIRERIKTLRDVATVADFFFAAELAPYDQPNSSPKKGDAAMALAVLQAARPILEATPFTHPALDAALRAEAARRGWKPARCSSPSAWPPVAAKAAPPLFETLEVLGRATCLKRIDRAILKLNSASRREDVTYAGSRNPRSFEFRPRNRPARLRDQ